MKKPQGDSITNVLVAIINVLESKGIVTKKEINEEICRLKEMDEDRIKSLVQ